MPLQYAAPSLPQPPHSLLWLVKEKRGMFTLLDYWGTTLDACGFLFPIVSKTREGKVKKKLQQCIDDPETPCLSRRYLEATGYLL